MSAATAVPFSAGRVTRGSTLPFLGLIDCVLVGDSGLFEFDGAIPREHAASAWTWMKRDLAPDLFDLAVLEDDPEAVGALEETLPELLARADKAIAGAGTSHDAERRLRMQLGGQNASRHLPQVVKALRSRKLLEKAQGLGANPTVLVTAATAVAGSETEIGVTRAGFAPLIDAILAHAQDQVDLLMQVGPFADVDLLCRALDRFNRLHRAVHGLLDLDQKGRWKMIVGRLTKAASDRIAPRMRSVLFDLNRALRRQREGVPDRLDSDQILVALGSIYMLKTVREARDSLALNAVLDKMWSQVGQALEIHIDRNLELLRKDPDDDITAARLDAAIKMGEVRIGTEYAEVMRRARDSALRKPEPRPEA